MSNQALAPVQINATSIIEEVIAKGDLKELKAEERARYYVEVCASMGLNPLTKPFDYITLNNKLTLYATKAATDQLRGLRGVTVQITSRERIDDLYVVTASARTPDGREDSDIGAVNIKGLAGDNLANAMMKATTKAKRRVTLSLCGLGLIDESEIETVPNAIRPVVDIETGEIIDDGRKTASIRELKTEHEAEKAAVAAHDVAPEQGPPIDWELRIDEAVATGQSYEEAKARFGEVVMTAQRRRDPLGFALLIMRAPSMAVAEYVYNRAHSIGLTEEAPIETAWVSARRIANEQELDDARVGAEAIRDLVNDMPDDFAGGTS